MEKGFLVTLKYICVTDIPELSYEEEKHPNMEETMQRIRDYADKHKTTHEFFEQFGTLYVERFDNGRFFEPDIYDVILNSKN